MSAPVAAPTSRPAPDARPATTSTAPSGLVGFNGIRRVPTPVNDAIVTVFKDVESGAVTPDPANVDRVWDLSHHTVRV